MTLLLFSAFLLFQTSAHSAGSGERPAWQHRRRRQSCCFGKSSRRSGALRVTQQTGAGEIQSICQGDLEMRLEMRERKWWDGSSHSWANVSVVWTPGRAVPFLTNRKCSNVCWQSQEKMEGVFVCLVGFSASLTLSCSIRRWQTWRSAWLSWRLLLAQDQTSRYLQILTLSLQTCPLGYFPRSFELNIS